MYDLLCIFSSHAGTIAIISPLLSLLFLLVALADTLLFCKVTVHNDFQCEVHVNVLLCFVFFHNVMILSDSCAT